MRSSTVFGGGLGSKRLRGSLAFTLALAIALVVTLPTAGAAQYAPKSYKKWYLSIGTALLVGIPAYAFTAEGGFNSACSSKNCVGLVAGLIGFTIGFLVGAEMDKNYVRRMAAGPSLNYSYRDVPLDLVPDRITQFPGGAAVVGVGGARIVMRDGTVVPRGSGVRGIEDVAVMPGLDLLIMSTFSNLISFPVENDSAQGQVIDERGGGALGVFENSLAVAGLDSLRLLQVTDSGGEVDVETLAAFQNLDFVTDMAFAGQGRVGWILMEDKLASYNSRLEKIGEVILPAAGRSVRARGNRLAVAAGSDGVYVLDATDPAVPRVVQHYTGVRFAYAADLQGDRLYVAAGTEGVALVDIGGEQAKVIGVARYSRFASDVLVSGSGEVWILDREGQSVLIADLGIESADGGANVGR